MGGDEQGQIFWSFHPCLRPPPQTPPPLLPPPAHESRSLSWAGLKVNTTGKHKMKHCSVGVSILFHCSIAAEENNSSTMQSSHFYYLITNPREWSHPPQFLIRTQIVVVYEFSEWLCNSVTIIVWLSVCLSICLFVCLLHCLTVFVCLSVSLPIDII